MNADSKSSEKNTRQNNKNKQNNLSVISNSITVSTGIVGTFSLYFYFNNDLDTAVRLILLALLLDMLDGFIARLFGVSSEEGEFLDRLFDRYYQIIVPAIMYADYNGWEPLPVLYASIIITVSLWRLVRRVKGRKYFAGAPLFIHTIVILTGFYIENPVPPWLMLIMAFLSFIPLKYYRRKMSESPQSNRGTYFLHRLIPVLILMLIPIPYSELFIPLLNINLAIVIHYSFVLYAMTGWVYFLFKGEGPLKKRLFYLESDEDCKESKEKSK